MSPLERWSLHVAALATGATGLLDGGLRWFGQRRGEFGPEPNPWLGLAQHLHVLVAPLLVFTLGIMVRGHLRVRLRGGTGGRATGLALAAFIAPMVVSGYAVQVAVNPAWRTACSWAHGLSASLFLLAYLGHLAVSLLQKAAEERQPAADS
jgi:hypothetical protein